MFFAIIPAYNEEKTIGSVVRSIFPYVDKVVVVDDGSDDKTAEQASATGCVVLRHKLNCGQGASLQTGHEYAKKNGVDFVLHFDADGQFDPMDIEEAKKSIIENNADILFGSRFLDNRSKIPLSKKYLLLPFGRVINNFLTGIKLSDAHNGFRILNSRALELLELNQDRMAHATEILALVKKNNLKYIEHPVKVNYFEYGQNINSGLKTIKDLFLGKFVK